jgi:transcriptional regulator with XRE-family HTH domain
MKIGDILRKYRDDHGYSLREFSRISGVSNSYLSMLESGRHPRTGRPIVPTLTKLNQIAAAMNMGVDDLIAIMDDTPVTFDDDPPALKLTSLEAEIIKRFRMLSDGEKNMFLRSIGIIEERG